MRPINIAVLTVSDRSFQGIRADLSGPALQEQAKTMGWNVLISAIVPDEIEEIKAKLISWIVDLHPDIILTTGGTGVAPRDVTPEATLSIIEKLVPGIPEVMRQESLKITPHAMLTRAIAGIRERTLIINLPGSPKAALENLAHIKNVVPHAVDLLRESPDAEKGHQFST